jgi:hypothetical protein
MHTRHWVDTVRLPGFWAACSIIFLANAFLSVGEGYWLLGALQLITAVAAAASAAGSTRKRLAGETTSAK